MNIRTLFFTSVVFLAAATSRAQLPSPSGTSSPSPAPPKIEFQNPFDDTYQFIFFATLEGLYRDGVSDADVKSLLARRDKESGYLNFIYTCPICMPVLGAIETYELRPAIHHLKDRNHETGERTFGDGLPADVSEALASPKTAVRLKAVNALVGKWMAYRMDHLALSDAQKKELIEELKKRRKEGMEALRSFSMGMHGKGAMKDYAAGYEDGDECAVCNAALQMPIKLKEP